MYTPAEIQTIKDLFESLVAARKIGLTFDAFGNPVQEYSKDAMNELANAIKFLPSFPKKEVVENAMLETSTDCYGEIFGDALYGNQYAAGIVYENVLHLIHEAAFLEISEHLFTTKQIQGMLRQHPDYLAVRESDIRTGRLEREELEDLKRLETGIQTQSEFNKTFGEVA